MAGSFSNMSSPVFTTFARRVVQLPPFGSTMLWFAGARKRKSNCASNPLNQNPPVDLTHDLETRKPKYFSGVLKAIVLGFWFFGLIVHSAMGLLALRAGLEDVLRGRTVP